MTRIPPSDAAADSQTASRTSSAGSSVYKGDSPLGWARHCVHEASAMKRIVDYPRLYDARLWPENRGA